ncbi:hypothetical protein INT43_006194 [Umbelopsis isabellina]|uniref:Uncharacterized protein n=1 Tax=Mortierella isabellina TaxID=91625 RepID=A0A8H7Q188_MORIS|nr:hypothetical protein INT43_006194 [Umbelopsis isabellina]
MEDILTMSFLSMITMRVIMSKKTIMIIIMSTNMAITIMAMMITVTAVLSPESLSQFLLTAKPTLFLAKLELWIPTAFA